MAGKALDTIAEIIAPYSGRVFSAFRAYRRPDGRAWGRFNSAAFLLQGIAPGSIVGTYAQFKAAGISLKGSHAAGYGFRFAPVLLDGYGNPADPRRVLSLPIGTYSQRANFERFPIFAAAQTANERKETKIDLFAGFEVPPLSSPLYTRVRGYIEQFKA